jgi:hypothetical protein
VFFFKAKIWFIALEEYIALLQVTRRILSRDSYNQIKLIEGEDFITRLKVINASYLKGIVVEADAVIALWPPNPNGKKKKNYEWHLVVFYS